MAMRPQRDKERSAPYKTKQKGAASTAAAEANHQTFELSAWEGSPSGNSSADADPFFKINHMANICLKTQQYWTPLSKRYANN